MIAYPGLVKNYVSYFDTPSKRNYLGLGITLLTLILLTVMIYPAFFYIFDLSSQLSKNREIDKALSEKIKSLETAKNTMDNFSSDFAVIDNALPSNTQVAEYLQYLEDAINTAQVSVLSLQFEETTLSQVENTPSSTLVPISFTMSLGGNFLNLKEALALLEKSPRVTDITSAAYNNNKDDSGRLKLTIRAKTYFYGTKDPSIATAN